MKLLLFTQVYPDEEGCKTLRSSSVCHYWTKEWVKQGHNVTVIYCYPNYHPILHWIAKRCPQFIAQFTNGTLTNRQVRSINYSKDGVEIIKIPIYKHIPKIRYTEKVINIVISKTLNSLKKKKYKPDLILSHFDNPILEIAGKCKDQLHTPLSFVLHGYAKDIKRLYPNNFKELINKVDVWGFRSQAIKEDFEKYYGMQKNSFICYSGIPKNYISNIISREKKEKRKVSFVGALIKRKYPEKIITALLPFLRKGSFTLNYIGEGALNKQIKNIAYQNKVLNKVHFLGHISREAVQQELSSSEYFIMISRHETFGLVYLEAMAHGCITIASENEGFDGIIKHGNNGFLCKAGDEQHLRKLIYQIEKMEENKKETIRENAIRTANKMTEEIVAKEYLHYVLTHITK